ncbi:carboxypeptidase-like regulatory domain-containing protein [Aeoliella sp.]|uniref:carboxypeptidase-like regulatory domain-containing protein n=1 Tax=Aeoliella sp. TaxID=2795800 RepID=UPI003CCBA13C
MRRLAIPTLLLGILTCVGCSDRAYVQGRVTRTDGSPVVKARVIARSADTGTSAHGLTDESGDYALGVMEKGDGLPPGEYTVVIVEDLGEFESPKPATVHPNYRHPTTSGLSLTLEPREKRAFDLELKLPPGRSN